MFQVDNGMVLWEKGYNGGTRCSVELSCARFHKALNFLKEIITIDKRGYIVSSEKNKALVRKMVEASNKKDLAVIDEFMTLDFVDHTSQVRGRENVKQGYAMVLKDYPDLHRTIEDIIAEGDKVWFLEKVTGTASSGKKMDATALNILRIVNGKAVEGWGGYIQQTA
jgi:predicted SnoaL-like aldol condensation-catalyzing enzyme